MKRRFVSLVLLIALTAIGAMPGYGLERVLQAPELILPEQGLDLATPANEDMQSTDPGPPYELQVTFAKDTTATLTWKYDGADYDGFTVIRRCTEDNVVTEADVPKTNRKWHDNYYRTYPNGTYLYLVQPYKKSGKTKIPLDRSKPLYFDYPYVEPVQDAVNFRGTPVGDTAIKLEWDYPLENATEFWLECRIIGENAAHYQMYDVLGTDRTYTFTDRIPGKTYNCQIRTSNMLIGHTEPIVIKVTTGAPAANPLVQTQKTILDAPKIIFNGVKVGQVIQSSTFTDAAYANAITAVYYNGKALPKGAGGFMVFAPQDDQSNEYFLQIDRGNVTAGGTIEIIVKATGYLDAKCSIPVAAAPLKKPPVLSAEGIPQGEEPLIVTTPADADFVNGVTSVTIDGLSYGKQYAVNVGGNLVIKAPQTKAGTKEILLNSTGYEAAKCSLVVYEIGQVELKPNIDPTLTIPAYDAMLKSGAKELRFHVGSGEYFVDNIRSTMDTTPIVSEGRTLLPIKYATEPLGATLDWNAADKKVTIKTSTKTIELWIGKNTAKINGVATLIDPGNTAVQPVILPPGRTMLPLRFVTENLGCDLEWNPSTKEVKITTK